MMADLTLVASDKTIRSLVAAAESDDGHQQLIKQINSGWPTSSADLPPGVKPFASFADELAVSGGLVFKGHRVVVPFPARDDILRRLHSSHIGINGCIRRAQEAVFYPGIIASITQLVSAPHIKPNHKKNQCFHTQLHPPP